MPPETARPGTPRDAGALFSHGMFRPLAHETTATDLAVSGTLPRQLDGLYVRASFTPHPALSGTVPHPFLGDGMLHGVRLHAGRAHWYRSRWVVTDAVAAATGRPPPAGPPDRRWAPHNPANTHVIAHAGRLLALCEVGLPYAVSPTLDTLERCDFDGQLDTAMCAHPKVDPRTGMLHAFAYRPRRPYVTYFRIDAAGRLAHRVALDVAGPVAMHDFAITQRYAVFIDQPLLFARPPRPGGGLPFRWDAGYGSRLGLLDLHAADAPVRWYPIDTCFVPHVVNAFDARGDVVLRAVLGDPCVMTGDAPDPACRLSMREWRIDRRNHRVSTRCLSEAPGELPRIDDRRTGLPHRYAYAMEVLPGPDWRASGGVFKYDFARGTVARHDVGVTGAAAEPVFVPAHADAEEDEGWLLCYVYDRVRDGSALAVIDARDVARPPVAWIPLPQRVPFGAHGSWVDAARLPGA